MSTAASEVQKPESQVGQESIQIDAIRNLTSELPLNDYGLPVGIYRTDLLPFHDYVPPGTKDLAVAVVDAVVVDDVPVVEQEGAPSRDTEVIPADHIYRMAGFPTKGLTVAFMPLQYDEGFPAFGSGAPFWARLEYEPADAFAAFHKYLMMSLGSAASSEDVEDDYDGAAASGIRSISQLASEMHPDSDLLRMVDLYKGYYHLYYWGMRAHAYDLFRVAQYRKQQEHRAIETQDEHYITSRRLRHKLMQYFDSQEDFWDLMTPKVGLDMLKTLTQLERISAGIPAAGPISEEMAAKAGMTFEMELQTIAQTNRPSQGTTITDEGELLDSALKDPAATEILQRLIIRSGGN